MIMRKLPEICEIKTGKRDANHANPSGKYRFYTCASQYSMCDTFSFSGESVIVPGNGDIGLVFYYNGDFEAYQRTYVLNNIKIYPKYLYYHLVYRWRYINSDKQYGSTVRYVRMSNFTSYEVPVPTLDEQKRIVARIEELFSELDNSVETLQKTKQQLAVYRQAVLKEAFEGKLTEHWRVKKQKVNEWKTVSITSLIQKDKYALKAGPFGSALKKESYVPTGYKVYGQEQVIAGNEEIGDYYISDEKYAELITCKVAPQDVLISLVGTVGKVLVLSDKCKPGIINPRLIKVSLDCEKIIPMFFKYYFESGYLRSLYKEKAHGATMDVLNMGMIKELPFAWCPVEEQKIVIEEIESRLSLCENVEKTINTALQQAEAMRQSILKQAFEGRL